MFLIITTEPIPQESVLQAGILSFQLPQNSSIQYCLFQR